MMRAGLPLLLVGWAALLCSPVRAQTLFGGDGDDTLADLGITPASQRVTVLTTDSSDWLAPGTSLPGGGTDLVLVILDGATPSASIYYGGSGDEQARAVALAADGTIWVAGATTSDDLPLVGALPEGGACTGCGLEGFVARFSADGGTLLFSTYLGGRSDGRDDEILDLVALPEGVALVGRTTSSAFPMRGGPIQGTHGSDVGAGDGFFARLEVDAAGTTTLAYSTYFGGNGEDRLSALALSPTGRLYLGGSSESSAATLSLTRAFDDTASGREGLLLALDPLPAGGFEVAWSSFLGGLSDDEVFGLAAIEGGLAVVGQADSGNFAPAAQATLSATPVGLDAFVVRLDDAGDRATLSWWTFVGGQGEDRFDAVTVFPDGQLAAAGKTDSTDLLPVDPQLGDALGLEGNEDALVAAFPADGLTLLWSEVLGSTGSESAVAITDATTAGTGFRAEFAGTSDSTDFLSTQGRTPAGANGFILGRTLYADSAAPEISGLTATFTEEGGGRFRVEASWTASDSDSEIVSTLWSVEPANDNEASIAHGPVEIGTVSTVNQPGLMLDPGVGYAVRVEVRDAAGLSSEAVSATFLVPGGPATDGGTSTDGGSADGGAGDDLEPVFGWSCTQVGGGGAGALGLLCLLAVFRRRRLG